MENCKIEFLLRKARFVLVFLYNRGERMLEEVENFRKGIKKI